MSKVIKKNASLAFVLLLSIPVCASQHDTAESIKKVSQSNAIAAVFSTIFAKSGVKTAGQNAFAWVSRTLPSWQKTMRQAPRAGLALVKRGTTAVVNASRHASSCVVPYVRPVVNFTQAHPRMTQVAVGSLFATGLTYALLKVVKHWKAHHPAAVVRTLPIADEAAQQVEDHQEAAGLGLDAKLPRKATRPKGTFRVPSKYQHQEPAVAAAAAQDTDALEQPQQIGKGEQHMQEEVVMPVATAAAPTTAPSLEKQLSMQKEEIEILKRTFNTVSLCLEHFKAIIEAGKYLNQLIATNATNQEIIKTNDLYFAMYLDNVDCQIGAIPAQFERIAELYNAISKEIMDILVHPENLKDARNCSRLQSLLLEMNNTIISQLKTEIQNSQETLRALEISLGR